MARYIDADKLVKQLEQYLKDCGDIDVYTRPVSTGTFLGIRSALGCVQSLPTADVEEVVRCGSCKFWNRAHISCEGYARCITGESGVRYRREGDFCSVGAKIDGKQ